MQARSSPAGSGAHIVRHARPPGMLAGDPTPDCGHTVGFDLGLVAPRKSGKKWRLGRQKSKIGGFRGSEGRRIARPDRERMGTVRPDRYRGRMRTIDWVDDAVELIDQTALPGELRIVRISSVADL